MSLSGSDHKRSQRRPKDTAVRLSVQPCVNMIMTPTGIRYVGWPHHPSDLLHALQIRTEPTVHCEDLFIDDGSNRQTVKAIGESLPKLDVITSFAYDK
jgi:hypothetical protein